MHVTSPRYWIALAGLGGLLVAVLIWSVFTTLSTTVPAEGVITGGSHTGSGLAATVFVKQTDSIAIQPGMDATLVLSGPQERQSSSLEGQVTSVSNLPASQSSMLRILGSKGLVETLSGSGQIVPIHVHLGPGSHQSSGSPSSTGRVGSIVGARTRVVRATITTSRERIIGMIIP